MKKSGISLVAIVITIIVMIVLVGVVIFTVTTNTENAQLAVFYGNVSTMQEATNIKLLNNMAQYAKVENVEYYRWIGIIDGYTENDAKNGVPPNFDDMVINGINTAKLDDSLIETLSIKKPEFDNYYISEEGVVYHKGFEYNGNTYYNRTDSNNPTTEEQTEGTYLAYGVSIGDFVEYDCGEWEETVATPVTEGAFGGYIAGTSKSTNSQYSLDPNSYGNGYYKNKYEGWRVLRVYRNVVTLVHAGTPVTYEYKDYTNRK